MAEYSRQEARSYLGALLIVLLALAALGTGLATVTRSLAARARPEARVDGLELRLVRAIWVDHEAEERRERGAKPHALLAGMPPEGRSRLAASVVVSNQAGAGRPFAWQDLVLRGPDDTEAFGASPDQRPAMHLPPGHSAQVDVWFDLKESDGPVTLWWERGAAREPLLVTRTPVHVQPVSAAPEVWPASATELPRGRVSAGKRLFHGKHACATCHGDPALGGSGSGAPHLGSIGFEAVRRLPDVTGAQYLYRSILDPAEYLAPSCAADSRCAAGPAMPYYGEVLTLQDAADLIAYLLEQRRPPAP